LFALGPLPISLLQVPSARAQIQEKPPSQYLHAVWTTDHGLPQNSVNAIVQTPDGYLWLGTNGGLARFDGVRFTVFHVGNSRLKSNRILSLAQGLAHNWVYALATDRAGQVWIGTYQGLQRLTGGAFIAEATKDGLSDNIHSVFEDREGNLWVGTAVGGLNRLTERNITTLT
jgi:ligand-binding sensor domain-containing protein